MDGVPILYIAYTLLRGPLAHWYPYFFVNPNHPGGYPRVAANSVAIALGQMAMALAIVAAPQLSTLRLWVSPTRSRDRS